jgi:hypothetical protein
MVAYKIMENKTSIVEDLRKMVDYAYENVGVKRYCFAIGENMLKDALAKTGYKNKRQLLRAVRKHHEPKISRFKIKIRTITPIQIEFEPELLDND